jgi:hypothetical protein
MPTLKLANANSGFITPSYIKDRQTDDGWSAEAGFFCQKSTAKLFDYQ